MNKAHGWLHDAHLLVAGVTCPKCLKNFSTRVRLLEHLMYKGRKCLSWLRLRGPVLTCQEAWQLASESAVVERQNARSGYRRAKAH
eukprot:10662846-Karenia_brevis.AAC.1